MKLENKKDLASRALKVGKNRIAFNKSRLTEIKEAITKQDFKDLKESGALTIKEINGRRTIVKRKTRRRAGSIKLKVNKSKHKYMALTRKLREHLKNLRAGGKIAPELYTKLRKEIRASNFKSLSQMKEHIKEEQNVA